MNAHFSRFALIFLILLVFCATPLISQQAASYSVVRLQNPLTVALEQHLTNEGVELLHYFGDGIYLISGESSVAQPVSDSELSKFKQIDSAVVDEIAARGSGGVVELDIVVAFPAAAAEVKQVLAKAGIAILNKQVEGGVSLSCSVPSDKIDYILANPLVVGITPSEGEMIPYNLELRIAQSVTPLNTSIVGAHDLNGQGMVIGVGDGGYLSGHPDIGDRVLSSTTYYNAGWGAHPDMVSGILGGGGTINPRHRGVACEAELVVEYTSAIVYYAPTHLANFGMTVTNNSYGPSFSCSTANKYFGASASADQQLYDNPALMHVFAAGNSGTSQCNGLPASYGTIPGGAQMAKNVLTVANLTNNRTRFSSSSAGPTLDGRLKPEISGIGTNVTTLNREVNYTSATGTSLSSPGVAGTIALLSQRFQQLNPGVLPDGALLKAIACNTASDLGNEGPDYHYGYGLIDGTRAVKAIEEERYYAGTLAPGASYQQNLTVPAGAEIAKILLYWPDQAGPTSNTEATLVNDFDLYVLTPGLDTIRPWVLDPLNPAAPATRGIDVLNNSEQVTITSPSAGTYTIRVEGTNLPLGSTDLYLSWEIEMPEVMITCPYGGESLQPNTTTYIAWSASSGQTGTWKVEYNENQTGWQTIASALPNQTRLYSWTVPNSTGELAIRVTNNSSLQSDVTNEAVTLIGTPSALSADTNCDGKIGLTWNAVPGASAYQVYGYVNSELELLTTVTQTNAIVNNLKVGEHGYYSVTAVASNGKPSERAFAIGATSEINGQNCQTPLPINWVSIGVEDKAGTVLVKWTVANEYDSDRYELYKGAPAGDTLQWELVTTVFSEGNGSDRWDYQAEDKSPAQVPVSYYRVKQIDLDGTTNYSAVISHVQQASAIQEQLPIRLAQNPVRDQLELRSDLNGPHQVALYDTAGRLRSTFEIQQGLNRIAWPGDLTAGLYFLHASGQMGTKSIKLVKAPKG